MYRPVPDDEERGGNRLSDGPGRTLDVHRVGRIGYSDALALQQRLVAARGEGEIGDVLLLLEHPPTVTLGRGAKRENLLFDEAAFASAGIEVHEIGRGGDVTYHGPGQLVGYPIVDLKPDRQDVRKYVASLEETMIRLCADYGITAERLEGFNGTWLDSEGFRPRKIGAVGVRISRWITMHGFALNVSPNMAHFASIVPCGIQGKGVTSLELEISQPPSMDEVIQRVGEHFAAIHQSEIRWHGGAP